MVIESIINPFKAERHPLTLIPIGFLYTSIAILLSLWIFERNASLVMVFLTVLACVPLFYVTIKSEEHKDVVIAAERTLLRQHAKVLLFLLLLFVGMVLSYASWYIFLPQEKTELLFQVQTQTITDINNHVTGKTIDPSAQLSVFVLIFLNNLKVLVFCLLFAFVYGVGAIFILTWNASVIGAAIGNFIRTNLAASSNYFQIVSVGVLKYALHGIPEIAAYFTAGLAGGIISVAVLQHRWGSRTFTKVLTDSSDMIIISIGLLLVAALVEIYVTPLVF